MLAHRIADEGACAQVRDIARFRTQAIALVNARRVPPALQDTLLSGVNALGAETPVCLPSVPPSQEPTTTAPTPAPAASPAPAPPHEHGHDHGRGDGKGHDRGHGHGKTH